MAIPENDFDNIQLFRDKYFVNEVTGDELITNEAVRILCWFDHGFLLNNHVQQKLIRFDIYVRNDARYNVDADRLKARDKVIAERIRRILTKKYSVQGLSFQHEHAYDASSRVIGYARYHTYFSFKISC